MFPKATPLAFLTLLLASLASSLGAPPVRSIPITEASPNTRDFTTVSWVNGWLDGAPREPALLAIETGHYLAVIDPFHANLLRLGAAASDLAPNATTTGPRAQDPGRAWLDPGPPSGWIRHAPDRPERTAPTARVAPDYEGTVDLKSVVASEQAWPQAPAASLELTAVRNGVTYRCVRAATQRKDSMNFPVRIVESGRLVQRLDILQLEFENDLGEHLDAEGRLEIIAWPDSLHLLLELAVPTASNTQPLTLGLRVMCPSTFEISQPSLPRHPPTAESATYSAGLTLIPTTHSRRATNSLPEESATDNPISALDLATGASLKAGFDPVRGWQRIELAPHSWSVASDPDHLDRVRIALTNDSPKARTFRLLFDDPSGTPAITGLTPMLRDPDGNPTGIPVQTSKNWHRQEKRRMLYEGPWMHAFTLVRLPPYSRTEAEFTVAFARWGGLPAASHAQLCLVGWGWNQVWDQAAIGSWGESICYEPDAIQVRCRIDDVRPLMVWGMGEGQRRWTWTHNVGGGDFLVYVDAHGNYQPWRSVRTAYLSQGPNLTDVTYAGVTADGAIACRVEVSTPRVDDVNRTYHRLRYEVLQPVRFSRLAFYQVGSDGYHWHQFGRMARGNTDGLMEEWDPGRGGKHYLRTGIQAPGQAAWFSMHQAVAADHLKPVQGAWATRGLIVRSWKARLGGKPAPLFASVYGTDAGNVPSANLELSPPPGLSQLQPGDYVEAELEFVILPMSAEDYYGPNTNLTAALREDANTWRGVHRLARGNDLKIRALNGRVTASYPPVIAMGPGQKAEIEITGGLGYLPITFTGLKSHAGWRLEIDDGRGPAAVNQSIHGHDFWQAQREAGSGTWRLTYNLPLDSPRDARRSRKVILRRGE